MKLGIVSDPACLLHSNGRYHPERPERLQAIEDVLNASLIVDRVERLAARDATPEELRWVHSADYVDRIEEACREPWHLLDADTAVGPGTWQAALRAVGASIVACESVLSSHVSRSFAFPRPPGHHAERQRAMGFCLFNNVAIAAEYAIRIGNLDRVAIVDWDVHHGNGTQQVFYDRDDLLYFSIHQYPLFPGTGMADETGAGAGEGYTINIPLPPGAGDERYLGLFRGRLWEAMRAFRPELILVSAGFDAHRDDPLGGMNLTSEGFGLLTDQITNMANEICDGKLVFILEGGYDLEALKSAVTVVLEILC